MRRAPLLLASAALALAGCSHPSGEDPSLVFDRLWIDSQPSKPTDYVNAVYLVPRPGIGVFQRSSTYDFHFERFDHQRDGQKLHVTFPQSGKASDLTFTVTACKDLPPFDLCLDLSQNPWSGPRRYHGMREQDDDDAALRRLRANLPAR